MSEYGTWATPEAQTRLPRVRDRAHRSVQDTAESAQIIDFSITPAIPMDPDAVSNTVVDPAVRAFVYSLVSALGGTGADEDGRYVLGDDGLAVLKDLKRWLKLYDEKANRLDVARCLAEANLVNGDLLQILSCWPEDAAEDKLKSKIALACLELLVPLTWPLDHEEERMTVNRHRHGPYIELAQTTYKRGILHHETGTILRRVVRIGLPSMAQPNSERTSRDQGIIKLVLYFLRNVVIISPPKNLPFEGDESEISRSATIDAFQEQDIFHLLLTVASSMGEDFNVQDVVLLEILFHLVKGVGVEKLFMNNEELEEAQSNDLKCLLKEEAGMKRGYARTAPSRHNRFGTMIWIKRDDERVSTVTGQEALLDSQKSLAKMDETKKWNKPRRAVKRTDGAQNDFETPVRLTSSARKHLREFVEEFLDSSFNPLFIHLRKAIEREAERIEDINVRQYFFVVSWFLEAERVRRSAKKAKSSGNVHLQAKETSEVDSFALVAGVLNQETFITMNRFMQQSFDLKFWENLNAGMRAFTQILLTVQEMSESPLEEDQEIAENIQNNIFYEETTHDRVVNIVRGYTDQGFGYLDTCTHLAHVFLRMLERYSKQNVDLQIRSRRRARKRKKAAQKSSGEGPSYDDGDDGSEADDGATAQQISKERKFDFTKFSAKFMSQHCVDTFVKLTKYYRELGTDQLKRAHRFFYRVAFKMESTVLLFRVDILALFLKMIKGPEGLDPNNPIFQEWNELVKQLIRRLVKKMDQRPEMAIELLFSKIPATLFFLEHGYEKQTVTNRARPPAELEVKPGMTSFEQIGIIVSVLLEQNKDEHVEWIKKVLRSSSEERQAWESERTARSLERQASEPDNKNAQLPDQSPAPIITITPENEAQRIAMFKDNKLRLLMTLVGFERLGIDDELGATWYIPGSTTAEQLKESADMVQKAQFDPPVFEEGKEAADFLRRKTTARQYSKSDGDDSQSDGEDDFLFPAGGPTARKPDALDELKKKRRKRRNKNDDGSMLELDDEEKERRRKAREQANEEKRRKIKSDLFVHDSDEDEDEDRDREFFAREEERRQTHSKAVLEAIANARSGDISLKQASGGKRKSTSRHQKEKRRRSDLLSASEDDILSLDDNLSIVETDDDLEDSVMEGTETPPTSNNLHSDDERPSQGSLVLSESAENIHTNDDAETSNGARDDEDEDMTIKAPPRRAKRGFIVESDSE